MNMLEKQMVDLLIRLKEQFYLTGVKAEFEAEGTRRDELLRLMEVTLRAGLEMNLKIGGCEAITDMYDAMRYGVDRIIAPLVETPYALKKYLLAVESSFPMDVRENMEFLINVETITTCNNLSDMLEIPEISALKGIVIGRVDMVGSLYNNSDRNTINNPEVLDICLKVAQQAKAKNLDVVVGGGVSFDSMPFFHAFPEGHLDRYETRKAVFSCPGALKNPLDAFLAAMEFELLWLKNKQNYYSRIAREDEQRIVMLEDRSERAKAMIQTNTNTQTPVYR